MRKLIFLSLIFTLTGSAPAAFGQAAIPSLVKLMSWANNMSYTNFDLEARRFGFGFDEKVEEDDKIQYSYLREVKKGEIIYTEELSYIIYESDTLTVIKFSTSRVDLIVFYSVALRANRFIPVECAVETESNQTAFCYQTAKFGAMLADEKKELNNGPGNVYKILLYKL